MIWVPLLLSAGHIIAFALWTIWVSFTPSTLVPVSGWVGLRNYTAVHGDAELEIAFDNLLLFGSGFVLLSLVTGLILAILLDQRIRGENVLRSIFLYPMAVSFVVTGTVWSWLLNPGLGVQKLVHDLGWTAFRFDWLIDRDMAIWTIVIAGDLAVLRLRHGAVPGRPALGRCRSDQGGADRRRRTDPHVPAGHPADAVADHGHRHRHPAAVRHYHVRPRARADRRRARESRPCCRRWSFTISCSSAACSAAARRRRC